MKKTAAAVFTDEKYNQLQQALEAADIGIWDWELDSDRVMMSENMKRLLDIGGPAADFSGETFLGIVHPVDRERIAAALRMAIERTSSFDEEFRTEKGTQTVQWLRIRGRVVGGADGKAERVMGSIHDKTERKMAYDAIEAARSQLEEKVEERTRELLEANERLRREIILKSDLQRQMMEISEKEQRRIGQDLHDSLSQQLGGILFMSQVLLEKLKKVAAREASDMKKLISHLQNALTYTRDLARGLYPSLGEGGLAAALDELAVSVSELFRVKVNLCCEKGLTSFDERLIIHVYRIVQEAINNAIRHGHASQVDIRLFCRDGTVVLTVSDNGVGFPDKPNMKGIGLNIMQYRASSIGASFEISSERERGTQVQCVFERQTAFVKKSRGDAP